MKHSDSDRRILRDLAKRVAEIADDPAMERRRRLWTKHNALHSTYPMMLVFPEGSWSELLPDASLQSAEKAAREIEWSLRARIYGYEHFQDDTVVDRRWVVGKRITNTGWGLEPRRIPSSEARGAWHFDPVLKTPADLAKLHYPEVVCDERATGRTLADIPVTARCPTGGGHQPRACRAGRAGERGRL